METIDDAAITELIEQGLSQRAIADQLKIPRSTLRRHLEKQKGKQKVHHKFTFTDELTQSWSEIQEVLDWWRERKRSLARTLDTTRKRRRQTYHVEERFIEAIRRAADLERTDLAEIVNRTFERYFSK